MDLYFIIKISVSFIGTDRPNFSHSLLKFCSSVSQKAAPTLPTLMEPA